jgi:hypothetical protein
MILALAERFGDAMKPIFDRLTSIEASDPFVSLTGFDAKAELFASRHPYWAVSILGAMAALLAYLVYLLLS